MSLENPLSILFNTEGLELSVSQSQALTGSGTQPGFMLLGSGSDGNAHYIRLSDDGSTFITGSIAVSNFPAVQAVSDNGGSLTVDGTVDIGNFPTVQEVTGTVTAQINQVVSVSNGGPIGASYDPIFVSSSQTNPLFITGSVTATATLAPNTAVSQGNPSNPADSWFVSITDGTQVIGDSTSSPIFVSGAVTVDGTVNVGNFPVTQSVKIDQSIVLPVSVSNFPEVQTVTGSVAITGNSSTTPFWVTGSVTTNFDPSTSATVTPVSSSATVVTLAAANGSRRGLTIYNDSTKILFVKLGSGASQTDFSVKLSSQGYYETPAQYTGIVTGLWSSVNGFGYVTEILD